MSASASSAKLTRQPFSGVQSSSAIQHPMALGGSVYRNVESLWQGTGVSSARGGTQLRRSVVLLNTAQDTVLGHARLTDTTDTRLLADDHGLEHARVRDAAVQTPRDVLDLVRRRDLAEHRVGEQAVPDLVDRTRGRVQEFRRVGVGQRRRLEEVADLLASAGPDRLSSWGEGGVEEGTHLVATGQEVIVADMLPVLPPSLERGQRVRRRVERVEQLVRPPEEPLHLVRCQEVGQREVPVVSFCPP